MQLKHPYTIIKISNNNNNGSNNNKIPKDLPHYNFKDRAKF